MHTFYRNTEYNVWPAIFFAIFFVTIVVYAGNEAKKVLDAPQVYISNSTGVCVKVVSPEGERPCQKGDEKKYERVWVK